MLGIVKATGFMIEEEWGWGFPRIATWSLDAIGSKYARAYAYSTIFHAIRD